MLQRYSTVCLLDLMARALSSSGGCALSLLQKVCGDSKTFTVRIQKKQTDPKSREARVQSAVVSASD